MRRVDRWLAGAQAWRLRTESEPLVVDLGYGASPDTAVELYQRLAKVQPGVRLTGIEIEPERVARAQALSTEKLNFILGGFEIPTEQQPTIVRAFNVLRQYEEEDVAEIWRTVLARLSPQGLFVDGTCDEIGRRAAWVALEKSGPVSLTIAQRFGSFELPSEVAERLPKALIHRNVPGEKVHGFLQALDRAWLEASALSTFGTRQRWQASCQALKDASWPVLDGPSRWRLGELTVAWDAVSPRATHSP
nr:class I SAM-dependent methyltransferase [Psychromicrobium silvestre]